MMSASMHVCRRCCIATIDQQNTLPDIRARCVHAACFVYTTFGLKYQFEAAREQASLQQFPSSVPETANSSSLPLVLSSATGILR